MKHIGFLMSNFCNIEDAMVEVETISLYKVSIKLNVLNWKSILSGKDVSRNENSGQTLVDM